jgi:hypothetical protein
MARRQVFDRVLPSFPVSIIPLMSCTHISFIYHRRYINLTTDSVIKLPTTHFCLLSPSSFTEPPQQWRNYTSERRETLIHLIFKNDKWKENRTLEASWRQRFILQSESHRQPKEKERESTVIFIQLATMATTPLPHICLPYSSNHPYGRDSRDHRSV